RGKIKLAKSSRVSRTMLLMVSDARFLLGLSSIE
ncbi:MAG: hypothetical protein ACI9LA_001586, partial [Bacteroidia bacterium]